VPGLQQGAFTRAKAEGREAATPVAPDVTYDDTWREDVGGETVRLRYYGAAHTGGDSVVHFENADVAHMGDLVFNRLPAFIDRPGGASVRGWIDLLERVHADFAGETLFVFGHGNDAFGGVTGTRADLLVMRDFLTGLLQHVTTGVAAGKTADELAAIERVPGFPDHYNPEWANALQNAVRTVYAEVTEKG
jgi:cyclase